MQNLFSYPLDVDELGSALRRYKLKADSDELAYIKEVLKVDDVKSFESQMEVKLYKSEHRLEVKGTAKADIELTSVISLEKFVKTYAPEFTVIFDTQMTPQELREIEFDFEDDVPDIIINGKIDLAEIAMEQIALVIDDFPRKEGEVFEFKSEFDEETTQAMNQFAALAKLKK